MSAPAEAGMNADVVSAEGAARNKESSHVMYECPQKQNCWAYNFGASKIYIERVNAFAKTLQITTKS